MYRILLTLTLILVLFGAAISQPFRFHADSMTYQLYLNKRWAPLLEETHSLLKRGIDFYYLRVRAGVAAYELKKYREAVTHLQIAYSALPGDDLVNSYYYWALKYSGQEDEASLLADQLSPSSLKETQAKKKGIINGITVETLFAWNKNYNELIAEGLSSLGGVSSFRSLVKNQTYNGLSLDHHLFPHINVFHNFGMMTINRTLQVNSRFNLPDTQHDPSVLQYQYFLNARYCLIKGWSFSASGTYLWGKSYNYSPLLRSSGKSDVIEDLWKIDDYVVNLGVIKETTHLKTVFNSGYGMINRFRQYQGTLSLIFYPFGNNNFYLVPDATFHWDEDPGKFNFVYQPRIGLKTGPFWITGEYGYGRIKNFYSGGGQVIYNIPEAVTGFWGVGLWAPLFKYKLNLSARYRQSKKEGTNFVFSDTFVSGNEPFTFLDQSLYFTLKWNL
jgi:hypothetical protein